MPSAAGHSARILEQDVICRAEKISGRGDDLGAIAVGFKRELQSCSNGAD